MALFEKLGKVSKKYVRVSSVSISLLSRCSVKKGVLKTLLKRDSNTDVFLQNLLNF